MGFTMVREPVLSDAHHYVPRSTVIDDSHQSEGMREDPRHPAKSGIALNLQRVICESRQPNTSQNP